MCQKNASKFVHFAQYVKNFIIFVKKLKTLDLTGVTPN